MTNDIPVPPVPGAEAEATPAAKPEATPAAKPATKPAQKKKAPARSKESTLYVRAAKEWQLYCPSQSKMIPGKDYDGVKVILDDWISAQLKAGVLEEV